MASPEQYRRYAADCLSVAQQIRNTADRAILLQKAEIWLTLAKQAERDGADAAQSAATQPSPDRGGEATGA